MHRAIPATLGRVILLTAVTIAVLVAFAASTVAHAQEPAVTPLRDSIEFGAISNASGTCRMNRRGRLLGIGGQDCVGQGQTARYLIQGDANAVINIQTIGSQAGNVRFEPTVGRRTTRTLNQRGTRRVTVYGDLSLLGPAAGGYSLAYTVSINYE